ncbi:DNA-binding transcriptional regulator YhcF (GntR family) [Spinactinospora alkalitolerans]|uniref:DNA-binding transcriptional regulator YhcF (GntR family) n=1 Tax=Spinactinospora alkalitolerans TaxID=687207 RepID=A0A852U557_9ACTN|nr:hypothetical protein [Spinactinospora alkalitolerans]NYE50642.1 DNA-binding transcriptional regulator YhcF (GntR family) [Spinactinospora alkalitolerans]
MARAYREPEQEGLLRSRGSRGTFVAPPPAQRAAPPEPGAATGPDAAAPDLRTPARALVQCARRAGADREALLSLVAEEWDGAAASEASPTEAGRY